MNNAFIYNKEKILSFAYFRTKSNYSEPNSIGLDIEIIEDDENFDVNSCTFAMSEPLPRKKKQKIEPMQKGAKNSIDVLASTIANAMEI